MPLVAPHSPNGSEETSRTFLCFALFFRGFHPRLLLRTRSPACFRDLTFGCLKIYRYFCAMRSFSQLYIMSVFEVKALEIGGDKFHIHLLYSSAGKVSELEIMRRVKIDSSKWINSHHLTEGRFGWQDGGGNFSYSQSQLDKVKAYIQNQKEHHKITTFREEYEKLMQRFNAEVSPYSLPDDPK